MVRTAFTGSAVVRCADCGLDHLQPVPAELTGVYEEGYFQAYRDAGMVFPTESDHLHPRYARRLLRVQRTRGAGRLLEIGVGHGAFLNFARQQGWETLGVDVSAYAAAHVRHRYNLEVVCGTLDDAALAPSSFDMVHLSHVLEHLTEPVTTLEAIRRVLKPAGVLAIEVPNELENLYVRLRGLVGRVRPYPVACTHVCFFTPATLARMLTRAGFRVGRLATIRDADDPRLVRRIMKAAGGAVERPFGRGPLIEAMAARAEE
jgi:SAM-dependent methyltransferase